MTDSPRDQELPGWGDGHPAQRRTPPPFTPAAPTGRAAPARGAAATAYPATETSWPQPTPAAAADDPRAGDWLHRYGPGVPATAPDSRTGLTAEEVWRTGQLPDRPARRGGTLRRRVGAALTVALLIASGVIIYLRLQPAPPLRVTGAAITAQTRNGCTTDVTGRIDTSGGSGVVSYQWVFTPQLTPPQPLSQSVTAGQSAVYVTAAVQGQGHGQLSQQVTLQILGPGQGSASAHVVISC